VRVSDEVADARGALRWVVSGAKARYSAALYEEVKEMIRDGRARAHQLDDGAALTTLAELEAFVAFDEGRLRDARVGFEGALASSEQSGDKVNESYALLGLGGVHEQSGAAGSPRPPGEVDRLVAPVGGRAAAGRKRQPL
jgi:hypothetical protein